jgi:hypothetical protein
VANGAELYSVNRGHGLRPLYTHPVFPAVVAAWFAALLGLGSLMLPADLIGRLLAAGGMAASASSFGFTARATIALAAALAGAGLGLSLARRVIGPAGIEGENCSSAQVALRCRPIDVVEDLGEEGIAEAEPGDRWYEAPSVDPASAVFDHPPAIDAAETVRPTPQSSLDNLGLMQLTARLASLLDARRTRSATQRAASGPIGRAAFGGNAPEASDADDAARAVADFFAPATPNPPGGGGQTDESCPPAFSRGPGMVSAVASPSGQGMAESTLPRRRSDRDGAAQSLRPALSAPDRDISES